MTTTNNQSGAAATLTNGMTDEKLIGYCEIHCTTERALFSVEQVKRMIELAGQQPGEELSRRTTGFISAHEEMAELCKLARERMAATTSNTAASGEEGCALDGGKCGIGGYCIDCPATAPAPQADDAWRRLALQFDGHRMQALGHLRMLLKHPDLHAPVAAEFLNAPPLDGEAILAQRIAALAAQQSAEPVAQIDWLGLALELEAQARRVESQTAECAMSAAAHGLRLMGPKYSLPSVPVIKYGMMKTAYETELQSLRAKLSQPAAAAPVDMILHCPKCGEQHIDAPEVLPMSKRVCGLDNMRPLEWTNPPHRSHLCHGCGHIWRPADVPTNGVKAIKTKGTNDSAAQVGEKGGAQ